MPIELITGLPGDGKTLLLMRKLREAAKRGDRPLYQSGIDGLVDGYAERIENMREWNAIDPDKVGTCKCGKRREHAHVVPDGALIFVDEAWKGFGHLHDARGQPAPPAVLELAEHRHRGIDFIWTTQSPSQIYPFARALIATHTHVVRVFGTHNAKLYTWGELNEDIKSRSMREVGQQEVMRFDPSLFELYKSATLHTIKRRIPRKVFLIPIVVVLALVAGYIAVQTLRPSSMASRITGTQPATADAHSASPGTSADGDRGKHKTQTPAEYLIAHTPRFAGQPWSAPIYDDHKVTTDPELLCMISGVGKSSDCRCFTEQATPYLEKLTVGECRFLALHGVYNPYRPSMKDAAREPGREAGTPLPAPVQTAIAHGAGTGEATVAHYGQIRTQPPAPVDAYPATPVRMGN